MEITWQGFATTILQILGAGSGAAAILYGIFAKWGEKWLDSRFAARLQQLQQVHERELEVVRWQVQNTFSRVSKIHEREFEVFPKIWLMLQDCLGQSFHAVGGTIIHLPDFRTNSDEVLGEYFASMKFTELERKRIMSPSDPDERFKECSRVISYRNMDEAKEKQRVLNNYIIENRVFMTPELDKMLSEVSLALGVGLGTYENGKRYSEFKLEREGYDKISALQNTLPPILEAIQNRLCHPAAATKPLMLG